MLPARLRSLFNVPLLRRVAFHARRVGTNVDRHFFTTLLSTVLGFVVTAAIVVTLLE
jgi:voltage-gated potassium channel